MPSNKAMNDKNDFLATQFLSNKLKPEAILPLTQSTFEIYFAVECL